MLLVGFNEYLWNWTNETFEVPERVNELRVLLVGGGGGGANGHAGGGGAGYVASGVFAEISNQLYKVKAGKAGRGAASTYNSNTVAGNTDGELFAAASGKTPTGFAGADGSSGGGAGRTLCTVSSGGSGGSNGGNCSSVSGGQGQGPYSDYLKLMMLNTFSAGAGGLKSQSGGGMNAAF